MMLNEAWQLARSLEAIGANIARKNPRVKEDPSMKASPPLRVRLGPAGDVAAVEEIGEDEWAGVWTIREGNANSFPIVRLTDPLILIKQHDSFWNKIDLDTLNTKWSARQDGVCLCALDWKRLRAKADELRCSTESSETPCLEVKQFAERFNLAARKPGALLSTIADFALAGWREGRFLSSGSKAVAGLLAGTWKKTKSGTWKQRADVQLLFDITDHPPLNGTIYCEDVCKHVVEVLPADNDNASSVKMPDGQSRDTVCALSGEQGALLTGTFPKVTLPVFKQEFPLFAKFKDAQCHQRYGTIESASMPVAQPSARRLQEVLSYIVAPHRQDCTWRAVASGKFERRNGKQHEKPDLLIVYPDAKPDIDARVAEIFGADDDTMERQFDADTNAVCDALDGVAKGQPASILQLFIVRKLDKARAMVITAESPTVSEVIAAARRWSEAAANVPEVVIPLPPSEKKQAPIEGEPRTPYPNQVVRLLSEQWARQGKQATKVPGIGLGDVLHLMLQSVGKWKSARDRMLDLFLSRLSPLLIGIGGQMVRYRHDKKPWDGYPKYARLAALRAVSVAGILLHACNRQREVYMRSPAFDIGQFLKLSDVLHKDYCIVVRKDSLPPSLIGNAMMPTAVDNPRRAVADLNDRMRVYTGWARTVRDPTNAGENDAALIAVREARKTLRRFEPLAERLMNSGLPDRCDNSMKAEMLLGYLAKVQDPQPTDKEQDRE